GELRAIVNVATISTRVRTVCSLNPSQRCFKWPLAKRQPNVRGFRPLRATNASSEHHMRKLALAAILFIVIRPALAVVGPEIDPRASLNVVQGWIYNYRNKPDYAHVPAAVRVLFHSETFKQPENAGIYLGFIAGAIASHPAKAERLINSFFPVPPEDQWVIVRAIAYSGLPEWRNLLRRVAVKMPGRQVMINAYLSGTLPTLTEIPLEEKKPGMMD